AVTTRLVEFSIGHRRPVTQRAVACSIGPGHHLDARNQYLASLRDCGFAREGAADRAAAIDGGINAVDLRSHAASRPVRFFYIVVTRALWIVIILVAATDAAAQRPISMPTAAGTQRSIDDIREDYRVHAGPFYVDPAILLKELGV